MLQMVINLDGDGAFKDLADKPRSKIIHVADDGTIGVSALAGGMQSGSTSVALRIDLPDGRTVLAETSLRLFLMAADALRARYGSGGD